MLSSTEPGAATQMKVVTRRIEPRLFPQTLSWSNSFCNHHHLFGNCKQQVSGNWNGLHFHSLLTQLHSSLQNSQKMFFQVGQERDRRMRSRDPGRQRRVQTQTEILSRGYGPFSAGFFSRTHHAMGRREKRWSHH